MSLNAQHTVGRLWVVATPIGNPGDLSPRAQNILARADCILAEDTRRTGLLLAACGVQPQRLWCLNDHNENERLDSILREIATGKEFALVSDAGTPLFSDPGYRLVKACRQHNICVSPVPGPSALAAALSASGIAPLPFIFLAFPPRKAGEQRKFFSPYASLPITTIFFERKDRIAETLTTVLALFGDREACIARELTKTYEEFILFPLSDFTRHTYDLRGELTVIIGPPHEMEKSSLTEARKILQELESTFSGLKPKEIAKLATEKLRGWNVSELYALKQGKIS